MPSDTTGQRLHGDSDTVNRVGGTEEPPWRHPPRDEQGSRPEGGRSPHPGHERPRGGPEVGSVVSGGHLGQGRLCEMNHSQGVRSLERHDKDRGGQAAIAP